MHRAVDVRTAAVIPALLGEVPLADEEIQHARDTGPDVIDALVNAAHRTGALRRDVTSGDIGMLIVRMSRPLPGGFPAETDNSLSHRHLDLLIDGLRAPARQHAVLGGPALGLDDLRQLPQPGPEPPAAPPATR
jgi:hypothetical protein